MGHDAVPKVQMGQKPYQMIAYLIMIFSIREKKKNTSDADTPAYQYIGRVVNTS